MRYASSKQTRRSNQKATVTAAAATGAGTTVAGKPQTSSVKSSPAAKNSRCATILRPAETCGTELKNICGASASIFES